MTASFKLETIRAVAKIRPAGYESEVMASGVVIAGTLHLEMPTYDRLRAKYGGMGEDVRPWWVAVVAKFKADGDVGPGDTVARLAAPVGGETFKAAFRRAFGFDCGCARRQDRWNKLYPYAKL